MKPCSQPDCPSPAVAKALCQKHYYRLRRYGCVETRKTLHTDDFIEAALNSSTDDCILWPFGGFGNGYGAYQKTTAHRVVCRLAHGEPTPEKFQAAHSCGNRMCVNPRHLRWATRLENAKDMIQHGRSNKGERHAMAIFTERQVAEIKRDLLNGKTGYSIAKRLGASQTAIRDIRIGKNWSWVQPAD